MFSHQGDPHIVERITTRFEPYIDLRQEAKSFGSQLPKRPASKFSYCRSPSWVSAMWIGYAPQRSPHNPTALLIVRFRGVKRTSLHSISAAFGTQIHDVVEAEAKPRQLEQYVKRHIVRTGAA